jgi:hypothetical protein
MGVLKNKTFWGEVFLLLLMPYPSSNTIIPYSFNMGTFNWVDNSGAFPAHSHIYQTNYYISDIMLVLMFCRVYFLVEFFIQLSPTTELQGKRLCVARNIEPDMSFHVRGCMAKYPVMSLTTLFAISLTFLSLMVQIFERPYY